VKEWEDLFEEWEDLFEEWREGAFLYGRDR
jgi:hypothetical protein